MSFRSDPLPSYEDVISGNFILKKSTKPAALSTESENIQQQKVEVGQYKYKTINKIIEMEYGELEDGEVSEGEEGEIKEAKHSNTKLSKIQKPQPQKPQQQKQQHKPLNAQVQKKTKTERSGANFASNISTASNGKTPFVPRLICRYFMEGICSKGDKCTFSHAVVPNKTPEEAKVKEPCKFFIAGSCMKGESCYYSHDLSVVPCKFFHLKGECSAVAKGSVCRFSHEPIDDESLEKLRQSEAERIKEKMAAEAIIESNTMTICQVLSTATKPEQLHACEETETATECPHDVDLLNPFAGDDDY